MPNPRSGSSTVETVTAVGAGVGTTEEGILGAASFARVVVVGTAGGFEVSLAAAALTAVLVAAI